MIKLTSKLIVEMLIIQLLLIAFISKNNALDCYQCTEEKSVNGKWLMKDVNEILAEIGTIDTNSNNG